MATAQANFATICDALYDRVSTTAERRNIANGYVWQVSDDEIFQTFNVLRVDLTDVMRAKIGYAGFKREVRRNAREGGEQAQKSTGDAAVTAAGDAAAAGL